MTEQQKSIWKMTKRYPDSCIGNIGGVIYFDKNIDPQSLRKVLCRLHEINTALNLRVNFEGKLYISEMDEDCITILDGPEAQIGEEKLKSLMNTPILAVDGCTVRYYIMDRDDGVWLLGIFHHLICDGIGLMKVTKEAYELATNPDSPLWEKNITDNSYLEYLEEEEKKQGEIKRIPDDYLDLIESEHMVFPNRRISNSPKANVTKKHITGNEYEAFCEYCESNGFTAEHLFTAALAIHDSSITGSKWASIGRVMINRRKKYMNTAGMFTNVLPIVVKVCEEDTFGKICRDIKILEYTMFRCRDLSLKELRDRKQFYGKMYDTCITYRPTKRLPLNHSSFMDEINCDAVEVGLRILIDEQIDGIQLTYQYMTDIYTYKEIESFHEDIMEIIRNGLVDDKRTSKSIEKINIDTHEASDIWDEFVKRVREEGDSECIIDSGKNGLVVTYKEAYEKVRRISGRLIKEKNNLKIDDTFMVGLKLYRSQMMPLTILACLNTKTVFVPIAVNESKERLDAIAKQVDFVIDDAWVESVLDVETEIDNTPDEKLNKDVLAYAIHTSGSTGNPKLVQIYRHALNVRLAWMKETFALDRCRVLQKTKNTFDVSVWELLLPFICGGTMIIVPDGYEREPEKMWDAVIKYNVDTMHFVPSMLSVCLKWLEQHGNKSDIPVKKFFSSGEVLSPSLVKNFYDSLPDTKLFNLYGPAECTIDVTWHECIKDEKKTPIGREVWNTSCRIVNQYGNAIPDGYCGELVVMGDLVGKGYVGNEEETQKRFGLIDGKRCYYTGDIVYRDDNGEYNYVGRKDREIKLRGMRINLSLLEQEAATLNGVRGVAANCIDNRLVLFLVTEKDKTKLRAELAQKVAPHYMPDILCNVDNIPYTQNGKCDYETLNKIIKQSGNSHVRENEEDKSNKYYETESLLAESLREILGLNEMPSPGTLISEFGLDSISRVEWMIKIEELGYKVHYDDIAGAESVSKLAEKLMEDRTNIKLLKKLSSDNICRDKSIQKRKLAIGVPYAGAGINSFLPLAKELEKYGFEFWACDTLENNSSVEELSKEIITEVKENIRSVDCRVSITVIGCCVGAALAVELTGKIKKIPNIECRLVMIGSLPTAFIGDKDKQRLMWDLFSHKVGGYGISVLSGHKVTVTEEMYDLVKKDARRYVSYFEDEVRQRVKTKTIMFFGDRDLLTIGYKKHYKSWKKYLSGPVKVVRLKGAYHFCLSTHAKKIALEIDKG
jgi:amino acid adenylation domain-containing protein